MQNKNDSLKEHLSPFAQMVFEIKQEIKEEKENEKISSNI